MFSGFTLLNLTSNISDAKIYNDSWTPTCSIYSSLLQYFKKLKWNIKTPALYCHLFDPRIRTTTWRSCFAIQLYMSLIWIMSRIDKHNQRSGTVALWGGLALYTSSYQMEPWKNVENSTAVWCVGALCARCSLSHTGHQTAFNIWWVRRWARRHRHLRSVWKWCKREFLPCHVFPANDA